MHDAGMEGRIGAKPQNSRWIMQKVAAEAGKTLVVLYFWALMCMPLGKG